MSEACALTLSNYLRRATRARPPAPRPSTADHSATCNDIAYPSSDTPVAGNVEGTTTVVVGAGVAGSVGAVVVAAIVVVVAGATVVVVGGATVVVVGAGSDVHDPDVEPSSPVIIIV